MIRNFLLLVFFIAATENCRAQNFDQFVWKNYTEANSGLESNHARDIIFDKKGQAWATVSGRGLMRLEKGKWLPINTADPLANGWFNDAELDNNGNFIIAGVVGSLVFYDPLNNKWDSIGTGANQPWILQKNSKGTIVVGSNVNGIGTVDFLKNGKLISIETSPTDVMGMNIDAKDNLYVGYRDRLVKFTMQADGSYIQNGKTVSEISAYDTYVDKKGKLWCASYSDLYLASIEPSGTKLYKDAPKDMHYDYNGSFQYVIHRMLILPDDRKLITTQFGIHLGVFDGSNWKSYSPPQNNVDGVERMVFDAKGNLWLTTWSNGIYVFGKKENLPVDDVPILSLEPMTSLPPEIELPPIPHSIPFTDVPRSFLPDSTRKLVTNATFKTRNQTVELFIRDSEKIDGDTLSVYLNGGLFIDHLPLTKTGATFQLTLLPGKNELVMYAHSLGRIPPCTAAVSIDDKTEQHSNILKADFKSCERLIIVAPE